MEAQKSTCPTCGGEVLVGDAFCPNCGQKLVWDNVPPAQPAAPVCPKCGQLITPGDAFCQHCGTPLGGGAQQQAPGYGQAPDNGDDQAYTGTDQPAYMFPGKPSDGFSNMSLIGLFFDFKGRLNRKRFFFRSVILSVISLILLMAGGMGTIFGFLFDLENGGSGGTKTGFSFILIILLLICVCQLSLVARRVHDLSHGDRLAFVYLFSPVGMILFYTGTAMLKGFLMGVIGQIFMWYLILAPGTKGPNAYGSDPLNKPGTI